MLAAVVDGESCDCAYDCRGGAEPMLVPDWKLPPGVSRSLWEFAHDAALPLDEQRHLADAPLLQFDRAVVQRWFAVPGRVLDLGCGTGRMLEAFLGDGWTYYGVDLSFESLTVAQRRANELNTHVVLGRANLAELSCLRDRQFDYAMLLFGTLGMVSGAENRRRVLAETARILKPRGQLAVHVHSVWRHFDNPAGRRWLLGDLLHRALGSPFAGDTARDYRGIPGMYHHAFTRRELTRLLRDAGFRVVESLPLAAGPASSALPAPAADPPAARPPVDLTLCGCCADWRATGWLVRAECRERV